MKLVRLLLRVEVKLRLSIKRGHEYTFYFLQEYPPTEKVMGDTLMAIFGALASTQRPRAERLILDLVATQLHGKDLTDLWDVKVGSKYDLGSNFT